MPAPVTTLQTANPGLGTVTRKPQTTAQQTVAGPFIRYGRKSQILGPVASGVAFGTLQNPTLKPVSGYLRSLILWTQATGGSGSATSATSSADSPYNVYASISFRDPFNQPIYQADGFSGYLITLYSGQTGMLGFGNNIAGLPSFSAIATSGNFTFELPIPLEMDSSGYCSLPDMNAASQPTMQIQLASNATVYSAVPSPTVPTVTVSINERFWSPPVDMPGLAPPDPGSSSQWTVAAASQAVTASVFNRIPLPPLGAWLHTLILVLRDANNVRSDLWPSTDLTLWIDGVPLYTEWLNDRQDQMYAQFGVTRPSGVIVYSFRDSIQSAVSTGDTHDLELPTTPATYLELSGTFGGLTGPGKLYAIYGMLYPKNAAGKPWTHLAS